MSGLKRAVLALTTLAIAGLLLFSLGPRETLGPMPPPPSLPEVTELDAWLTAREGVFDDLVPGTAKRIVWAGEPGEARDLAIVYLHGFSASNREVSPLFETVAAEAGANLYLPRLAGHGRGGDALGMASSEDWLEDLAEAVAVGMRLGRRVVLAGTSTGGSLATLAAADPVLGPELAGLVLISPNFRQRNPGAQALTLPFARQLLPLFYGPERSFKPHNEAHGRYWTTRYPVEALFPMAAVAEAALRAEHGQILRPVLLFYSDRDQVVDPAASRGVALSWGGPVRLEQRVPGTGDDPDAHVLAGDILSPGQTGEVAGIILEWLAALP